MLVFTNRKIDDGRFGRAFAPGKTTLSCADARPAGNGTWQLDALDEDADDTAAVSALIAPFSGTRPVLVYLHGFNNTPQACFERCALLEQLYDVEVIGLCWPSEGYLPDGTAPGHAPNTAPGDENHLAALDETEPGEDAHIGLASGYRQAKTNAQESVEATARFLRLLALARLQARGQPFSLAAHSLGAHLLQNTLQIDAARESLGSAFNIALLAACTRATGHAEWVARLRPQGRVFVTYNFGDTVLTGAAIADHGDTKLGTEPGSERVANGVVRYVDFSNSPVGPFGHGYFVFNGLLPKTKKLFRRMFGSQPDLQGKEYPRQIYQLGCDPDGVTCYIGTAVNEPGGGG